MKPKKKKRKEGITTIDFADGEHWEIPDSAFQKQIDQQNADLRLAIKMGFLPKNTKMIPPFKKGKK
jgi:hypothetical protein